MEKWYPEDVAELSWVLPQHMDHKPRGHSESQEPADMLRAICTFPYLALCCFLRGKKKSNLVARALGSQSPCFR